MDLVRRADLLPRDDGGERLLVYRACSKLLEGAQEERLYPEQHSSFELRRRGELLWSPCYRIAGAVEAAGAVEPGFRAAVCTRSADVCD